MKWLAVSSVCVAFSLAAGSALAAPWDKPGWAITFHDEFDAPPLNTQTWGFRYKWGEAVINGELEAYVDAAHVDNAFTIDGTGILNIVGSQASASYGGQTLAYTSGLITSVPSQKFGYFEARLRMPKGQGLWPAFWLLGDNGTTGVNEIDIQETLGNAPNTVYMTVHWGTSYTVNHQSDSKAFTGPDFSADFHVFGLEWDQDAVIWTIDGVEQHRHEGVGVPQVSMYLIANLAIGGSWPGPPDATTVFPATYAIDYIRAYQKVATDAGVDAGIDEAGAAATPDAGSPENQSGAGGSLSAAGASGTVGMPTGGSSGSAGALPSVPSSAAKSSGCACRAATSDPQSQWFGLGLAALGLAVSTARRRSKG
jgi:MYXO-CTERM domain-containing protein